MRRFLILLVAFCGVAVAAVAGVLIYAASANLAPLLQRYSQTVLGRPVKLDSLYLDIGRTLHLAARDVRLPAAGDPKLPDLATIEHTETSVRLLPLLTGRLVIESLVIDDLKVMLVRDDDGTGNWTTSSQTQSKKTSQCERTTLPPLLDAAVRNADITYVDSSGKPFPVHIDHLQLHTPGPANPVQLDVTGTVDDVPLTLKAALHSFNELQDFTKPFGGKVTVTSASNSFTYDGTATDPLDLGGLNGKVDIDAPGLSSLAASIGMKPPTDLRLSLVGSLNGRNDQWQLHDVEGKLQDASFNGAADYSGGARGEADALSSTIHFDSLDLDALVGQGGSGGSTTLPEVPEHPGLVFDVRVDAKAVSYQGFTFEDLKTHVVTEPGKGKLEVARFGFAGGQVSASAAAENGRGGLRISGSASVDGVGAGDAYRAAGSAAPPLHGALSGRLQLDLTGATLTDALSHGRIAGAMSMSGGTISRKLVRMAKGNIRALWTDSDATTPLRCILAAVDIHDGAGMVNPVQVETPIGTLAAWGQVSLQQGTLDMILQSQDQTTDGLALDVPIHISGPFTDPDMQPSPDLLQDHSRPTSSGTWPAELESIIQTSACNPG